MERETKAQKSGSKVVRPQVEDRILKTLDRVSLGKPPDHKKEVNKNEA